MQKIAAIISTFNRKNYLKKIVCQLESQLLPPHVSLTIIVVVDGSTDGTLEFLSFHPNILVVIGDGKYWFTRSINEGILTAQKISADFVLILNDDTEILNNYISKLWNDYNNCPNLSILGSASITIEPSNLIDFSGNQQFNWFLLKSKPYLSNFTPINKDFKGVHPTYTINGRGTFIPMQVIKKIGLLDEKLVQYGSDVEYALRAFKREVPVFISWNARVYNNLFMTSKGATFRKDSLINFFKSFFNPYSINSIRKNAYLYWKYGIKLFLPFYICFVIIGTTKSYILKQLK